MAEHHHPQGHAEITPYICVSPAAEAIDFYVRAFGASEVHRMVDGARVSHAEISIDGARVFLADEFPEIGVLSPKSLGGSPVLLHLTVPDCDAFFERAVAAGARAERQPADQGNGHRNATIFDPYGHRWMFSTFS